MDVMKIKGLVDAGTFDKSRTLLQSIVAMLTRLATSR